MRFWKNFDIDRINSRESFLYLLDKEVKRARRHNYLFCILKLTLSHLSSRENEKGLQACFQRLIHFAEKELRESDIPGFLGEYQLAMILPYTDPITASHAKSRLMECLEYYDFKKEGYEVKIGQICFPADGANTTALIDQLMKKKYHSIFPP